MFQKKKGFTLIELLAVIVILAVIALIATPLIMNVINDAKKNSFKDSAYGIIKAVELRAMQQSIEGLGGTYKVTITGDNSDITYSGDKPTSGIAVVDSNGNVKVYMCNDSYCATNTDTSDNKTVEVRVETGSTEQDAIKAKITQITTDTTIPSINDAEPSAPDPVAFATDSWETINQAVKNNNISAYHVGDIKEVVMNVNDDEEDETYHIMVVNTTACETETSETACGLVLQFQELLNITNNENKKMNPTATSVGGWPASAMRTYLNGDVYNKLKAAIGDIIVETNVVSGHESGVEKNYTSQDYLYLLSTKEVGFPVDWDSAKAETRKLDYYSDEASRIKYEYGTTTEYEWWLRGVYSSNAYYFGSVDTDGSAINGRRANNTSTSGVAPAFRVGK